MAKERPDDSEKSPEEVRDRIWELAKKINICMFTTWDGARQNSRPLAARTARDEHAIYFLVDAGGGKNDELEHFPEVSCAWADNSTYKYAVVSGQAKLSNDRVKIKKLFTTFDKAWWESDDDPNIRLLTLTPERGELWDSPGQKQAYRSPRRKKVDFVYKRMLCCLFAALCPLASHASSPVG